MRATVLVGLLALSACAPTLADGIFACPDRSCPSGFLCHPDGICRRGPPRDAGGPPIDGPIADAPAPPSDAPPGGYYARCTRDAECESGRCHLGFNPTPWVVGYCSEPCDLSTDCGAITGEPYANCSLAGACELYCLAASQCPLPFRCVGSFRESGTTIGHCYPPDQPIAPSTMPCAIDSECTEDMDCITFSGTTRCRRPCDAGYVCGPTETCQDTGTTGRYCVPM